MPTEVKIIGAPVACKEGIKELWRDVASWAANQLIAKFGSNVITYYYDLFDPDEEIEILIHSEQKYIEVQYIFQMYYDSLIKVNAIIEEIDNNCTTSDDDALLEFYLSKLEEISDEMNGYKKKINELIIFDDINDKIIEYLKLKK